MSSTVAALEKRFYPDFKHTNWDDEIFRERILKVLAPEMELLDLGAGAGIVREMDFGGKARRICGVDLDPRVTSNPYLDEGKVGSGEAVPYGDASFDIVIADNVVEHLTDPHAVFREIFRVLKPGGHFLFKTPNVYHYMPTIARLTPTAFHQFYNRIRGRETVDTFPTQYRANSAGAVRRVALGAGLKVEEIWRFEGRPEYLRVAAPLFLMGLAYERLVNSTKVFEMFRLSLIAHLRKKC